MKHTLIRAFAGELRTVPLAPEGNDRVEFSGGSAKAWAGWTRLTSGEEFRATERLNNGKSPWADFSPGQPRKAVIDPQ